MSTQFKVRGHTISVDGGGGLKSAYTWRCSCGKSATRQAISPGQAEQDAIKHIKLTLPPG